MKNTNLIAIFILSMIIIIAAVSYFLVQSENVNDFNLDVFEVNDEHDDARTFIAELNEKGYETEDGAWASLELNPTYSFGVRFANVSLPTNITIMDVYIELYSSSSPGLNNINCKVYCDNVDNSVNFTIFGALNISGRNYTRNYSRWNTTLPYGEWVKSPSVTDAVSEVISRDNWTSGNSIAVLFVSEGVKGYSATFQNFEKGYPAKLYIKWKNT